MTSMSTAMPKVRDLGVARLVALGLGVVLLILAAVLAWQTHSLRDDPATENRALIDQAGANGVSTVVARGLTAVLSYDYTQPDATKVAADQILSGQARSEYDTLFKSLQQRAPGQKLVLTAQVQVSGVQQLTPDKAKLLVFIDQSSTRKQDKESSVSAAQLAITAERSGNRWVITGLKPL